MAIGVCLVVIIILFQVPSLLNFIKELRLVPELSSLLYQPVKFPNIFSLLKVLIFSSLFILAQGMKLLPTGRKSALYSTICGLAVSVPYCCMLYDFRDVYALFVFTLF